MAHYYPPPVFHFKVEVRLAGLALPDGRTFRANDNDVRFAEAGGLSMEMTTEELPEGGENRFVQKYPLRAKYPELVLKRGLLVGSPVFEWMRAAIQDFQILPTSVFVMLLNREHERAHDLAPGERLPDQVDARRPERVRQHGRDRDPADVLPVLHGRSQSGDGRGLRCR